MSVHSRSSRTAIYSNIPYLCDSVFSPALFRPVDTHYTTQGIQIVGIIPTTHTQTSLNPTSSLQEAFKNLPTSLQHICGNIHFPQRDGEDILSQTLESMTLFGASDVSFRNGRGTHAWIISTG